MYTYKEFAYFYISKTNRSLDLDETYINAKLFRFSNDLDIVSYDGFIRTGKFTNINIRYGMAISRCYPEPGIVYNNAVWFNMEDEMYSNMSNSDLRDLAINAFISKELEAIEKYNTLIKKANNRIEFLNKISKEVKK